MRDWKPEVRRRLSPLRLPAERETEIVDEVSAHLEDHWRELVTGGTLEEDATTRTLALFGSSDGLAQYMAPLRQSNLRTPPVCGLASGRVLTDIWQDIRSAGRTLHRQPAFALAIVLTLALGVGANSAIFTVIRSVLLESLPFDQDGRVYRLRMVSPDGSTGGTLSAPDFMSVRTENRVFERVEAYAGGTVTMAGAGEAQEVRAVSISDGLLSLLDMPTAIGRHFRREEHAPGKNEVAILDNGFWHRAFGGDTAAIGRKVTIGGSAYLIVGVLAPGARLPADEPGGKVGNGADVYLPFEYGEAFDSGTIRRGSRVLAVLGKARLGVTASGIAQDLSRIASRLGADFPKTNRALTIDAVSVREFLVGDVRTPLLVLFGAVGFVLLVACATLAVVLLVVLGSAAVAAVVPARRAAGLDPADTLRHG